jgi:hypothetical protein
VDVKKYLSDLRNQLFKADNWKTISLNRQWTSTVPSKAGVYALKEGTEIVYIGETGNLQGRMNDLLDSRHHTIRRTIGQRLFSNHKGFVPATTKVKFPDEFEILVNEHITKKLKLAYLTVELGRKELEEIIEQDIKTEIKLNKRGKRKSK